MGWRDVIGAVLDATAAAPARQASRTTSANNKASAPASDTTASLARQRPARPAPPEPERPAPERAWSAAVFDHIEWRRFEAVCEALFAQSGMRSESQLHGADGGVDIRLYSQHSDRPVIVQCRGLKTCVLSVTKPHDMEIYPPLTLWHRPIEAEETLAAKHGAHVSRRIKQNCHK